MIVDCAEYFEGKRLSTVEVDDISKVLKRPDHFVWIGIEAPNAERVKILQREFGLHDLAIEDALRAHQRPKIESYGDTVFIVMRTVEMKAGNVDLGETHFFLGHNFIISIRHGTSVGYIDVRSRCEKTPKLLASGPSFALYAIMDFIVDQYFPVVNALEDELTVVEERIFDEKYRRDNTEKIYQLKRKILDVKRAVSPLIEICNRLMRFDLKIIDEETKHYFRDIYDHAVRLNEMVDNTRELLSAALEANLSMINISQSEVSKRFAGWAALIGIPTMIAGIYGMNFKHMPELAWAWSYPLVILFTILACTLLYFRFKRSGWL